MAFAKYDNWQAHFADTLTAGVQHNQQQATEILVKEGPAAVNELIQDGLLFDRRADDTDFQYGLEGAHSFPRILHCLGDQTGKVMTGFLQEQLAQRPQVTWLEQAMVTELLVSSKQKTTSEKPASWSTASGTAHTAEEQLPRCIGLRYLDGKSGRIHRLDGDAVVLATGGLGGLFPLTTNDVAIPGDGMALA